MNLLLVIVILVAIAWLGGVYLFGRRGKVGLYTAGVEYLLLGALLNSSGILPLSRQIFSSLTPFVHLELAWIGLLYGVQLEWRRLRLRRSTDWAVIAGESLLTMAAAFLAGYFLLIVWLHLPQAQAVPAALVMAFAASLSSPWAVGALYNTFRMRTALVRRLQYIAVLDDLPGLIGFSALFFYPSEAVHSPQS